MTRRALPGPDLPMWHYTCHHGNRALFAQMREAGFAQLRPGSDGVVWCTDLGDPVRDGLGLTMNYTTCDRTEYRWRIAERDIGRVVPWTSVRRDIDPVRVEAIESSPGALPMHWFVSFMPVLAFPA